MLYDFMMQVNSHLDAVRWDASGKKVDVNQQILERIVRKNEKQKVSTTVHLCGLHAVNTAFLTLIK